jgi:outer membrane protein OmpA-like peptidoglycan-associated protein
MRVAGILFIFLFASSVFGQSYPIVEIDINCVSLDLLEVNSEHHDYCPFVRGEYLYFTSDRESSLLLDGENNWSKNKKTNIFKAKIKGDGLKFGQVSLLSNELTGLGDVGTAVFSASGDSLFFARSEFIEKEDRAALQLYMSVMVNGKWSEPTKLSFCTTNASFGQPFYDSKHKQLYFTSNMNGGRGGKDIYVSTIEDGLWSPPVSLQNVNSSADEMFPYVQDGVFFFSSNRAGGVGGLDIYWKVLLQENEPKNLLGLNSEADDFGIYVSNDLKTGYYSSSRNSDDNLYNFEMTKNVKVHNEIAGSFAFNQVDGVASNVKVQVLDENNFVLFETTTDDDGNFIFREVDPDGNYTLKALTEDELKMKLYNQYGDPAGNYLADKDKRFIFREIGYAKSGTLSLIPDDMIDVNTGLGKLSAQLIYDDQPGVYPANRPVALINESGEVIYSTSTDKQGNFEFKDIPMDKNYVLKIDQGNEDYLMLIYNSKDNVIAQLKSGKDGVFKFRKLSPAYQHKLEIQEEDDLAFVFEDKTIAGYFEYNNKKEANREGLIVKAFDQDGKEITKELTDKNGEFRFKSLPLNRSILFQLNDNGENFIIDDFTLYIYDRDGKKIAELKQGADGFFTYRPLGYDTENSLTSVEEDNLKFILGENKEKSIILVYFDSNQESVKKRDMPTIDKLHKVLLANPEIKVGISAYADAKATDEYNLVLSGKRGDWIVDYLVRKGVDRKRFVVSAYGESKLVDESNDALNRRAEIRLY